MSVHCLTLGPILETELDIMLWIICVCQYLFLIHGNCCCICCLTSIYFFKCMLNNCSLWTAFLLLDRFHSNHINQGMFQINHCECTALCKIPFRDHLFVFIQMAIQYLFLIIFQKTILMVNYFHFQLASHAVLICTGQYLSTIRQIKIFNTVLTVKDVSVIFC